jgi:hypothetical protein
MAAKNLREAILIPLTEKGIYLSEEQTLRLEGELKDFFAHQIMIRLGSPPRDSFPELLMRWREQEITLLSLFHGVFGKGLFGK